MGQGVACSVDGCGKPVARAGYCWGHLKRLARGQPVNEVLRPRYDDEWNGVMDAIFALIDIGDGQEEDEAWRKAVRRLRRRIQVYKAANPNQYTKRH